MSPNISFLCKKNPETKRKQSTKQEGSFLLHPSMPPLRINKKLKPAKRAWKSFTELLKSKFRDLKIATSVRDSTSRVLEFLSRRLIVPFKTRYLKNTGSRTYRYNYNYNNDESSRVLEFLSHRLIAPLKRKCLKSPDIHRYRYNYNYNDYKYLQIQQYQSQPRSDCSSTCVDRLYGGKSFREKEGVSRSEEKVAGRKQEKEEEEGEGLEIVDSMEEAWRRVVAASPHLRIDERAEEFISNFREERRIEKERSLLEFQERLKRSA